MKMTFRWYGPDDAVGLGAIKQIPGVQGIVSALHDIPTGELWKLDAVKERKSLIEDAGFTWSVVESIPLHEEIKRGGKDRDLYIERWQESLRNVGSAGVPVVCYNFMPVLDWTRTDLAHTRSDDSSVCLTFVEEDLASFSGSLPGWEEAYTPTELQEAIDAYKEIDTETYWSHLKYFLEAVLPVAEEVGVKLAIHPDDPPFSLFGLPRIITGAQSIKRLVELVDSPANGITFCTGSYGILPENDLVEMVKQSKDRIYFAHVRNIRRTRVEKDSVDFQECAHCDVDGDLDIAGVVQALVEVGFDGPVRPDHGRSIWDEKGRPGYWLHDRALGAQYLLGLEKAYRKTMAA